VPGVKLFALTATALCAIALAGWGEEAAEIRDGVNQVQDGVDDAQRLRDAARDFDVANAEQRVRDAVGDGQPVKDVDCPVRPRINWELGAVEIECKAVLDNGGQVTVPVRYVPGQGFSTGRVEAAG
jgi:hypothetical protein